MALREKVVPLAYGNVLEVGMGSAVNMALYDPAKGARAFYWNA